MRCGRTTLSVDPHSFVRLREKNGSSRGCQEPKDMGLWAIVAIAATMDPNIRCERSNDALAADEGKHTECESQDLIEAAGAAIRAIATRLDSGASTGRTWQLPALDNAPCEYDISPATQRWIAASSFPLP